MHEKLSQLLSEVFTEVVLSEIISFHAISALREFAHEICIFPPEARRETRLAQNTLEYLKIVSEITLNNKELN